MSSEVTGAAKPAPPIPPHAYYAAAFALVGVVAALSRPPNGPVIVPTIINGEGNRVRQEAPLPQVRDRATVDGMPEAAQRVESAVYRPGDRVMIPGVYFPFGKIASRGSTVGVATGLQVAHESWFEVGAVLPELTGYEAGGVWVREQ